MTTQEQAHAYQNAKAWTSSIANYVSAANGETWERLEELRDERDDFDGDSPAGARDEWMVENGEELKDLEESLSEFKDAEDAREQAQESALSVEVRSGWGSPGEEMTAEDFQILLSTGGPALRIRGELNKGEPSRAWLEYQDWGTPWTEYHGENADQGTLLSFCSFFFF